MGVRGAGASQSVCASWRFPATHPPGSDACAAAAAAGAVAPQPPPTEVSGLVIASSDYGLRQERRFVLDVGEAYGCSLLGT